MMMSSLNIYTKLITVMPACLPVLLCVALLLAALAAPLAVAGAPAHLNSCRANFDPASPSLPYKYCQPDVPIAERVADLLAHMTTLEKTQSLDSIGNPRIDRLGVPTLPGGEGLHGVASGCGAVSSPASTGCPTSFPSPPAMGSSFDKELWAQVGQTIGTEARALYNQGIAGIYLFTPNVNPSRDQRWVRSHCFRRWKMVFFCACAFFLSVFLLPENPIMINFFFELPGTRPRGAV